LLLDNELAIYDRAAQLPDRYQRHKPHLALRRLCQRRYHTAVLHGNLHLRRGESHANADRDSDGNAHTDSYAYCNSNSYAYTDSYAYGHSNSYAYTDSYAYGHSDSYAYTDSYAYGHSDSYAYTDSYAYVDTNNPAETKPDTKATSDAAASSVGPSLKPASPWVLGEVGDHCGAALSGSGGRTRLGIFARKCFGSAMSSHRFQSWSKSRKRREDAHALRRSGSYRTKRCLLTLQRFSPITWGLAESAVRIKAKMRLTHFRGFW
jgi:hypothetical protein